jgi:type III secretion HrpO family protein
MEPSDLTRLTTDALLLVVLLSAPAVAASLVVGVVVGALQATTQLQDPALSFAPRLVAVGLALALAASWMGAELLAFTRAIFEALP